MKVFGKLRPGAVVAVRWPTESEHPFAGEDRTCDVKVIDCKNGQVTLGFEGAALAALKRGAEGSDPTET